MNIFRELFAEIKIEMIIKTGFRIFFILVLSWFLAKILKRFLYRLEKQLTKRSESSGETPSESEKRIETIVRLVRQGAMLTMYLIVFLILLKEIGVDVGPIVASAGIVGVALGFGSQNLVRDIISGFFIILENQIRVGDVATINGTGGLVENINFRTIVLRDLRGVVHIFPNGTITTMSNSTYEWSAHVFEIGVAYKENIDNVIKLMNKTGEKLFHDKEFGQYMLEVPEIFGLDKFDDSAVVIKGRIKTMPSRQWEIGREYLRRIKITFDENQVEIPFPHRTIFFGEPVKPIDIQIAEKSKKSKK
ncbi:MAG: mechanosensitive ion channel family protein [Spirochaetia bacterium]|nr:mechanosensitive ion channel family protein [Spirochaetia bacterium]